MTDLTTTVECYVMQAGEGKNSSWAPVPCDLRFFSSDPLAATLHFGADVENAVEWTFALDLLVQIQNAPHAGIGDIRFGYDMLEPDFLLVRLSSPNGVCLMRLKSAHVRHYVHAVKSLLGAQPSDDIVAAALNSAINAILESSTDSSSED